MSTALKMVVDSQEIIDAVKKMKKQDREARAEYKAGRVVSHKDVFGS